jgi:hypothetical protein
MALYRVTLRRSEGDDKSPTARVVYVVSAGGIAGYRQSRRKAERLHPGWKATRTNRVQ